MLHISLPELMSRAAKQVPAHKVRLGVYERHNVL
jgi:hypothetical protein